MTKWDMDFGPTVSEVAARTGGRPGRLRRMTAAAALALLAPAVVAGETVYRSRGPGGPVYSDVPSPGSETITPPPPNVVQPPRIPVPELKPGAEPEKAKEPAAQPYRSLRITQPEHEGSASDNTALFEVRVAVEPELQFRLGHTYVVTLNGRTVERRYTSNEMMIPPEFFGDSLRAGERFHLAVGIVDLEGRTLIRATPVEFTLRHVVVRPGRPPRPGPAR